MKLNTIYPVDVDVDMSHIDVMFSLVEDVNGEGVQGGLWNSQGETMVSVIRRGCFVFDLDRPKHASYWAEKLNITKSEAQAIIDLL